MGIVMSVVMGKGLPMLNLLLGTLYSRFMERDVTDFEEFHIAILDILNALNKSLPGKHYDAPRRKEIEACFAKWKAAGESERRKVFVEFMKEEVKQSKLDYATMITGLVTPPAAMAAMACFAKSIPDVVFVPSATVVVLISLQLCRRIFLGNLASTS